MKTSRTIRQGLIAGALLVAGSLAVWAAPGDTNARQLIAQFSAQAGSTASAARGKALFTGRHTGGKPDTPSCTTCHTANLKGPGKTRAGKVIEPMALSVNPNRFTDSAKVAKWFRRNCNSVLGRECTAGEKADILAWLSSI
ncbi:MAG TPA: DUF1924 domain-containing protein [Aliiroseovarius sp.]|nr:DUF1924 domain-containing protein [Aliiroseovarius sp.]